MEEGAGTTVIIEIATLHAGACKRNKEDNLHTGFIKLDEWSIVC